MLKVKVDDVVRSAPPDGVETCKRELEIEGDGEGCTLTVLEPETWPLTFAVPLCTSVNVAVRLDESDAAASADTVGDSSSVCDGLCCSDVLDARKAERVVLTGQVRELEFEFAVVFVGGTV